MKLKKRNKVLDEAAVSACAAYIDLVFNNETFEELKPKERFRLVNVLVQTNKLDSRYQA
tara:strand:- start:27412 stop:27588 length:177 start_codon:yes stop_codon:yes gene_type:complete